MCSPEVKIIFPRTCVHPSQSLTCCPMLEMMKQISKIMPPNQSGADKRGRKRIMELCRVSKREDPLSRFPHFQLYQGREHSYWFTFFFLSISFYLFSYILFPTSFFTPCICLIILFFLPSLLLIGLWS